MFKNILFVALVVMCFSSFLKAEKTAVAELKTLEGVSIGKVELLEIVPKQGLVVKVNLNGLTPGGVHGFHIHEVGSCDPETQFKSAGGHFNPDMKEHGLVLQGRHAGDLGNIIVDSSGKVQVEMIASDMTLEKGNKYSLNDMDGSAVMIHANADNYKDMSSGGSRFACGVFKFSK